MSVVTAVDKHDISISYFDGRDQLIPFRGYYVEGTAPHVPENMQCPDDTPHECNPSWVCFELTHDGSIEEFFKATTELARMLFCDLGFTSEQVMELMEDF